MLFIPDTRIQRGALGRDLTAWFDVEPGPRLINQGNGVTTGTAFDADVTINSGYPGHVDADGWWDQSTNTSWANLGGDDQQTSVDLTWGAEAVVLDNGDFEYWLLRGADTGSGGAGWGVLLVCNTSHQVQTNIVGTAGGTYGGVSYSVIDDLPRPIGERVFAVGRYVFSTGALDLFVNGQWRGTTTSSATKRLLRRGNNGNGGGWTTGIDQNSALRPGRIRSAFAHEGAMGDDEIAALSERVLWRPSLFHFPTVVGGGPATFDSDIYYRTLLSGGHL